MSFAVGLSVGVAVGFVFGAVLVLARTPALHAQGAGDGDGDGPAASVGDATPSMPSFDDPYQGRPMSELLTTPPIIDTIFGQKTLGEYLKHHPQRDGVWHGVVAEFYARAAGDVRIAPYFAGVGLDRLQKHFMAAVMLVPGFRS